MFSIGFTLQEILLINTDSNWKEIFIDRNVYKEVNLYKILDIKNFGFYLNFDEKNFMSEMKDRKFISKAMLTLFPLNAPSAHDIDYLIKPSK